jgi:hypothetical protein
MIAERQTTEGDASPAPTSAIPETRPERLVVATPETMRMSQSPPTQFSSRAYLELWLKLYARQISIPEAEQSREY